MNAPQFTPGPWAVFEDGERFEVAVGQIGEDRICEPLGDTPEQATANGHLIAAAPELYAALAEMHRACLGTPVGGGDGGTYVVGTPSAGAMNKANAALRKARGEQSS